MAEIKWTNEQKKIIELQDKNLLVSASAGSGKTTVMIARVLNLMQTKHIPISKFLIVTFTKASASDMKKKLVDKLLELPTNDFVLEQIDDVATSDISDLHSFYSKLVSTYFYELNIDPKMNIVDDAEASLLKDRAVKKLFEKKEKIGDENYFKIFDIFQKKRNDTTLKNIIFQFDNYLNSLIDGDAWFKEKLDKSYDTNLNTNICATSLNRFVAGQILEDANEAESFAKKCFDVGFEPYGNHFNDIASTLKTVRADKDFLTNAKNINEIELARTPSPVPEKFKFLCTDAKILKDKIRKNLANYQKNYVSADGEILKNGLEFGKQILTNLYSLVKEFNAEYSELKREINSLDFNDLERYAMKILSNGAILDAVKAKYDYIFVDEYQDINEVQDFIISKLSRDNNRFMVGDVKQSIYGFRLSDPEIFLKKLDDYSKSDKDEVIPLNCNFRSDKKILKFVDTVFSGIMTEKFGGIDYASESLFVPGENNLDNPKSINLCFINSSKEKPVDDELSGVYSVKNHKVIETVEESRAVAEANYVAQKIAQLTDKRKENSLKYSEIAVLVSSRNAFTKKFIEQLKSFGVPVSSDDKYDLLSKNYVQEILNFIKLVVSEKDDILLFKVLKSKLFNFSDSELVEIRKLNFKARFCEAIFEFKNLENAALKEKVQNYFQKLEEFKNYSKFLLLPDFANKIIEEFCLTEINFASINGKQINEEIDLFVQKLPETHVVDFVLGYDNFKLEFQNECSGDAVNVMTIHKSKGIEFKAVFLINTSGEFNMQSTFGNILFHKDFGVGVDYFDYQSRAQIGTVVMSAISTFSKRKLVEEQQRLLYVALTRAIEKMYVVCVGDENILSPAFKDHPNSFFCWFEPIIFKAIHGEIPEFINFESYDISDLIYSEKQENRQLLLNAKQNIKLKDFEYKYIESSAIPLKSSVSKILAQAEEPQEREDFVLSEDFVSSADRGTIYHKVFEKVDLKHLDDIDSQLDSILQTEFDAYQRKLIDLSKIKKALSFDIFTLIRQDDVVIKEREFFAEVSTSLITGNKTSDDKFILQGVIDLLIVKKDEILLLDYKTGKISEIKIEKYKFQINAYADVVERALQRKVTKKYLLFVDEEKLIEI